ncbi:SpoIIE family protein phosphatase [Mycobacterium simiae]|uniref:SpoIIE family protein phosphatase n=2 Tax=Mycobacterium simiae TaxID=1784 RepID=A0A5B1BT25_MYCSI|nr:SpoIIE family protein phosphatase [Mycobacterium simiae]
MAGLFALVAALYTVGAESSWHSSGVAAIGFAAGAELSWQSFGPAVGFAFFPPAGVTVSALLLTKRTRWPVIVAAIVAAELVVSTGHGVGIWAAAGLAGANAVEPLVGASLVRRWCRGAPDLRRRTDLARFVAGACVLGPLVGGLLGAAVGVLYAGIWWPGGVARWWAGDGLGALVVGAPALLWPRQRQLLNERRVEAASVVVLTAALSVAAFSLTSPPALLLLPLLAWAAFRLEVIGAALASAVLAFVANLMTAAGHGAFAVVPLPGPARLAVTQGFIAVIMLIALLIGQEAAGRISAIRQRQAEQRERTRLQSLAKLGESLAAALTPKEIGRVTAAQVRNYAGAQALTLGVISDDGGALQWVQLAGYPEAIATRFGAGLPLTESSAASDAARTGTPVLIRTAAEYQQRYPQTARWMTEAGAASIGVWPLTVAERQIGVLGLMWTQPQALDATQRSYALAVASMVTQALLRARAYADEHARATVLQAAVLPAHPAEIAGLEFAVSYHPADVAHGLGGDWWDAMSLPKNRTLLAVGDVVGHGLSAVEDMAQLRAAGRALAVQGLAPAQLLAELNIFTGHASHGKFATMTVAILDPGAGALRYGSAGHPPALLRRCGSGQVIRLDGGRGPVLGPLRDAAYDHDQVPIAPGDILVMYTDGLIDRRGRDLETAIAEAQQHIAGWQADTSLREACQSLTSALAPPPRDDDVCVLAVKFR